MSTFHEFGASLGAATVSSLVGAGLTTATIGEPRFTHALTAAVISALIAAVVTAALTPRTPDS